VTRVRPKRKIVGKPSDLFKKPNGLNESLCPGGAIDRWWSEAGQHLAEQDIRTAEAHADGTVRKA
jgi:hypothetical protein